MRRVHAALAVGPASLPHSEKGKHDWLPQLRLLFVFLPHNGFKMVKMIDGLKMVLMLLLLLLLNSSAEP